MSETISNIDQLIAARDIIDKGLNDLSVSIPIFLVVHPSKCLPDEFIIIKSIAQFDNGNPLIDGTVEICLYVRNLSTADDQTQPDLSRIKALTDMIIPIIKEAQKYAVFFWDINTTIVNDSEIRYFYNSVLVRTKSINLK